MKKLTIQLTVLMVAVTVATFTSAQTAASAPKFVKGLDQNLKSALILLSKKADAGDGPSQMRLGLQYYAGESLVKDDKRAVIYLKQAVKSNTPQAAEALKIIEFNLGVLAQKAGQYVEAAAHFTSAANLGDSEAKERLAQLEGKLIPEFPPAGTGLKNAEGLFPEGIDPHPISAYYEYIFACLEDPEKAAAQPDFSRQKIALAYGDITISKGNSLFTIHDLDPVSAEALYRGLRPHKKLRVALQDELNTKSLIFSFR